MIASETHSTDQILQNLKDYTSVCFALLWQRQAIFFSASLLTGLYFDATQAAIFYCTILFCELQDLMIARRIRRIHPNNKEAVALALLWIVLNTLLSSAAICIYAVSVAIKQDIGGHFTPLFFLFAAALFAAMNNHQIVLALVLRLAMYGISFFVIVVRDLWVERPPLSSDLWLHFFTVVFVMYFLIDCSFVFLRLYRKNLIQLQALRVEHERTKAALLVKSQFISTVSHELRTPLTSIKGALELLNSGALGQVPEKMQGLVDMAGKNGARLSDLIDDVLDIQKIESGEMDYRMEVVDVPALVDEAIASNQGYAERYGVNIRRDHDPAGPSYILGDERRLMQVMSNMISNAIKFSHSGGTVTVGCETLGETVRIFVTDTGIGIPDGAKAKVFGRFTQLDSSDQRRAAGSGLGMSISKEIVEQFNGVIDYISEFGAGTTFFTEFPAYQERSAPLNRVG